MAEVTQVWGLWDCNECLAVGVSGKARSCPSCGAARTQRELDAIYLPPRDPVTNRVIGKQHYVTPEENDRIGHGADSDCPYCGGTVSAALTHCENCGALQEGVRYPARPEPAPAPPDPGRGKAKGCLVVLFLIVAAAVGFGIWANATHEVRGTVVSMTWTQTTWAETFKPTTREDWRSGIRVGPPRMPVNGGGEVAGATLRGCHDKHHHYKKVPDGTERVAVHKTRQVQTGSRESCSHSNNGDGSFTQTCRDVPTYTTESYTEYETRTRYRDVSVTQAWCSYDTWAWFKGTQRTLDGVGSEGMAWPEVPLERLDRRRRRGTYSVIVEYTDGDEVQRYDVKPTDETEYRAWRVGDSGTLVVNNLGGVEEGLKKEIVVPE